MPVVLSKKTPFISVVIRSKDEADRLRLTLASLQRQTEESEVVVVDDGSSDHTPAVLAEAAACLPLTAIRHPVALGRSAASNAGARHARGEVLLFLDGDTLAGPDLLARHAALHAASTNVFGRGEGRHLRCTRMFRDPQNGTPWPDQAEAIARRPREEVDRMRVTYAQVVDAFGEIERRAEPGIYPGAGPRRLYELEMDALQNFPDSDVLWAAACASNASIRRESFLRAGGFHESIDINEHRELALKLMSDGARLRPVPGARQYHLTHRSGWRDPLQETAWEAVFLKEHPIPGVALLSIFWASLSPQSPIPPPYRINTLPQMELAARGAYGLDYDVARRSLRLAVLGAEFWQGAKRNRHANAGGIES